MTHVTSRIERKDVARQVSDLELAKLNERFGRVQRALPRLERRRPFVVEFAGLPKAGKTGVRAAIAHVATKAGFEVLYPDEAASQPSQRALREDLTAFNAWTGMYALQHLLNGCIPVNRYDLVLLDRGLFDACCWIEMLKRREYVRPVAAQRTSAFFSLEEWTRLIDMVVVFECDAETALERERAGALTVARLERTGPLLADLRSVFQDEEMHKTFKTRGDRVLYVDTSGKEPNKKAVAYEVANQILMMIEDALSPTYAMIPRACLSFHGFRAANDVDFEEWKDSMSLVRSEVAEIDTNAKQLVAYAFIEINGKYLRLHRTGHANRPELKSMLSIGIGGHVESKDVEDGFSVRDILKASLHRELSEELLMDEIPECKLVGFINDESTEAGMHHIAAVHHVRLKQGSARVRIGVSDQEFGENSWALVPKERLFDEVDRFDPWSQIMISELLGGPEPKEKQSHIVWPE